MNKLWTRDFTIITLGSVVSMMGNAIAGFSMSLLVLDYTNSSLLYAIYMAVYMLPQIFTPIFSGALLDRFSRRKTIYTLDFLSCILYISLSFLLMHDFFNFPILALFCFIIGIISSVYMVAYQSFYPLLITEGNYSKAYSISSVIETFALIMVPIAAFAYNSIGIAPLLAINSVCFLIAAVMETQIRHQEKYIDERKSSEISNKVKQMMDDLKEGFNYLYVEKGLLFISIYFAFQSLANGASQVIALPYFKANYAYGEYVYMIIMGASMIGRGIGGALHYRFKIKKEWKFMIAFVVYILVGLIEGSYLFFNVPLMTLMMFASGILSVTSYTIRLSATQNYVPHEKKGRFNGAFNMINTAGTFVGDIIAGALAVFMPEKIVLAIFMYFGVIMAFIIIGRNGKHIKPVYNTDN